MKRSLLLTVAVLCCASLAFGQAGTMGVYGDDAGTNCNITDTAPGLLSIYVVHAGTGGATGIEFAVPPPTCLVGTYLSWGTPFSVAIGNPVIGNPGATPPVAPGASIGYGACVSGNVLVGTIGWFGSGGTAACCFYDVIAHEVTGLLVYTDCGTPFPAKLPIVTVHNTVNGDATCACGATPTENSTWGGVKALYSTQN